MSLASRVDALEDRLFALEVAVQKLTEVVLGSEPSEYLLVEDLPREEASVSGLGPNPSPAFPPPARPRSGGSSRAAASSSEGPIGFSPEPRRSGSSAPSASGVPAPSTDGRSFSPRARAAACREIGLFLRRAKNGEHRGASGRDRLPGASRYWVVVRNFSGEELHPVGIFSRFSDCKSLVKRGSDLGDSVCIGLPSRGDVIAVLNAADIPLPDSW